MNRYDIVSVATGQVTNSYQAESPLPDQPEWGSRAWNEIVIDDNGNSTTVTHPATFTVVVTDLTAQLKQAAIDAWVQARNDQCDADCAALLEPMQDVTHIAIALQAVAYLSGFLGATDDAGKAAAQATVQAELTKFGQVMALRATRDADIAAYIAAQNGA